MQALPEHSEPRDIPLPQPLQQCLVWESSCLGQNPLPTFYWLACDLAQDSVSLFLSFFTYTMGAIPVAFSGGCWEHL